MRSPDGESRGLPLGKLSIQRAAAMVTLTSLTDNITITIINPNIITNGKLSIQRVTIFLTDNITTIVTTINPNIII